MFYRLCIQNSAFGLAQIGQKSEKWQWRYSLLTWHLVKCFWRCFVSLFKFTYWSKFHVNIITDSGFMTIFFYKGLKRNPEIGNTPAWVLPNIWRLGRIRDTKFVTYVSNEMLLNTAKCQSYSFYGFWVIKGKPIGKGLKILPHQDRAKNANGWKCRRFYGCLFVLSRYITLKLFSRTLENDFIKGFTLFTKNFIKIL